MNVKASDGSHSETQRIVIEISNVSETGMLTSVSGPQRGLYMKDQRPSFTVNLSEAATVTGVPALKLTAGANPITAYYDAANRKATALRFIYDVSAEDLDADGISGSCTTP